MARIFAVTLDPGDGPTDLFLVEKDSGASIDDVKQSVLAFLRSNDMDAVTVEQLTVADVGSPEYIWALGDVAAQVVLKPQAAL